MVAAVPPQLERALADRYRFERLLGSGGMATVYLASDLRHQRRVAVKVLDPQLATTLGPERFQREIGIAGRLNHPHVLPMLDSGVSDGFYFYVMPFAEGESLRDRLRREIQLPVEEAVRIGSEVADALDYAHRQGIVHRDIKPENVLLQSGHAVVADFGIARALDAAGAGSMTGSGMMIGTPAYMSPEQAAASGHLDGRADLYALGCLLYEMLAGQAPFVAPTVEGLIRQQLSAEPPRVTQIRPAVSMALADVVQRLLAKAPADRYARGEQVITALKSAMATGSSSNAAVAPTSPRVTDEGAETIAIRKPAARKVGRWLWIAAGIAVLLVATLVDQSTRRRLPSSAAEDRPTAIVVLPFANLSADKDQEYFSDGLSEELLNVLSRNPKLRVTSRTSAFSFKGKAVDIRTIADKLHVTHVLEGSVRKAGDQLRITAQLIEVASDSHLWSETYDRQMENIFAVQEDIAGSVAGALNAALRGDSAAAAGVTSPSAYDAYLQGRYFYEHRTKADFEKALEYFEQALEIDPNYARAWMGLSDVHTFQADWGYRPLHEGYALARREVQKALALDPRLAGAHAQLGWIKTTYDWDWAGADSAYKRALALEPNNARVIQSAAWLAGTLGHSAEAIALCRRAVELDPLLIAAYNNLGVQTYEAGRWEDSRAAFEKVLAMDPRYPDVHTHLGCIHLLQSNPDKALAEFLKESDDWRRLFGSALAFHGAGRKKEADSAQGEFIRKYGDVGAFQAAEISAYRGKTDQAFEWLERAYRQRDGGLAGIKNDPLLSSLEGDARFDRLLQKMKLPID